MTFSPQHVTEDYISRTIATVRNHRDADNCWPQWANIFADEIERLRARLAKAEQERDEARHEAVMAERLVDANRTERWNSVETRHSQKLEARLRELEQEHAKTRADLQAAFDAERREAAEAERLRTRLREYEGTS